MFYPLDSLRKGGTFYFCWLADSWPEHFGKITQKQLRSQNIQQICDNIQEVVTKETRIASERFSLRLSAQLMRGVTRIYEKKVNVFFSDVCMLNASVLNHCHDNLEVNDSSNSSERRPASRRGRVRAIAGVPVPDNEERLEERIQNSGNVVGNIQDITLKEVELPQIAVATDGFGEEDPEEAVQLLNDRTIELMLAAMDASAAHHSASGLETSAEADKSRPPLPDSNQMERISEHEMSDNQKYISESQPPALPAPSPDIQKRQEPIASEEIAELTVTATAMLEFEELEEIEGEPKRRRRLKKLIIDKKTKISGNVIRSRLENVAIELRCENSSEDIADPRFVSASLLLQRAARAGWRLHSNFGAHFCRMFSRNLGLVRRPPRDHIIEELLARNRRSVMEKIIGENVPEEHTAQKEEPVQENVADEQNNNIIPLDMSELPTQVLPRASQEPRERKRSADTEARHSPAAKKGRRLSGIKSINISQRTLRENFSIEQAAITPEVEMPILEIETIQQQEQEDVPIMREEPDAQEVTQLLEMAGLADNDITSAPNGNQPRRNSEGSDTQNPSLDRTAVDLGDSDKSTEQQIFVRAEWGNRGTMLKVMRLIRRGVRPVSVRELVRRGPLGASGEKIVAARCFTSLLKLKLNQFLVLHKDDETLAIKDMSLGSKAKL